MYGLSRFPAKESLPKGQPLLEWTQSLGSVKDETAGLPKERFTLRLPPSA